MEKVINWLKSNWLRLAWIFLPVFLFILYYYLIFVPKLEVEKSINNTSSALSQVNNNSFEEELVKQLLGGNVGYLAISVTIILTLAGLYTFFNINPLNKKMDEYDSLRKSDLENLEKRELEIIKKVEEKIENILQSKEGEQKKLLLDMKGEFDDAKNDARANYSRSMAFHAENLKSFDNAFDWAVSAAYYFNLINDPENARAWVEKAEDYLDQASSGEFNAKFFDRRQGDINICLEGLRRNYATSVGKIENLLKQKLEDAQRINSLPLKLDEKK